MLVKNEERVEHLLNDVVEYARGRLPEPTFTVIEPFLRGYYELLDVVDVQSRDLADLYGGAMAHWQTAQKFVTGREVLRVYNPNLEQHGWHSDHTVVEIVNDDMPFLVDSVTMEVNRLGLALHSAIHPVFRVWRAKSGAIERIGLGHSDAGQTPGQTQADQQSALESFIHFEVDRCGEAAKLDELRVNIARVLGDVRAAVMDWPKIIDIARATIGELKAQDTSPDGNEARAFLEWMVADHFTFLGHRDYELVTQDGAFALRGVAGSGAGILRETLRPPTGDDVTLLPPCGRIDHRRRDADLSHEGQLACDGASAGLPGLRRREAGRAGWQGHRRTALSRALYIDRLSRADLRDSDRAAQVREHRAACGLPRERALAQVADLGARTVSARRAFSGRRRRALRHRARRAAFAGTSAHAPVRAARPLRPLRVVPRVRAARQVQHRLATAHLEGADGGVQRQEHRVHAALVGVAARAHSHHRARREGREARGGHARTRNACGAGRAPLAGRSRRCADRQPR